MKGKKYFCFWGAVLVLCAACSAKAQGETVPEAVREKKLEIAEEPEFGYAFTIAEDGSIFTIDEEGVLQVITAEGGKAVMASGFQDITAMCSCGDGLLAYDMLNGTVFRIDRQNGEKTMLADGLFAADMLRMDVLEDSLYVLFVPLDYHASMRENGYMDLDETLSCISLSDGKKEETGIFNVMDFFVSDGKLFYYAYQNDTYVLGEYNPATGKTRVLRDMMNQYGTGYASGILYRNGIFAYAEMDTPAVHFLRMPEGMEVLELEGHLVVHGNDLFSRGNTVFCRSFLGEEERLTSVYLPDLLN